MCVHEIIGNSSIMKKKTFSNRAVQIKWFNYSYRTKFNSGSVLMQFSKHCYP